MAEILKKQKKKKVKDKKNEEVSEAVENAWEMKIPTFKKGDMKHTLQEETRFEIAFPKYREKYIKECFPVLKKMLDVSIALSVFSYLILYLETVLEVK